MKILHTSDWHLGQEFYSYDRTEEHIAFLEQLKDIVEKEQPDVLAVAGDIYHNATPSNTVMRLFTDYLDRVRSACPTMKIVVIAGNHDSSSRLEVTRTLWSHLGVYIVGRIEKKDEGVDFDRLILPIEGREGEVMGYVVALPFTSPQSFPLIEENTPRELRQSLFLEALGHRVEALNTGGKPVVMMAHMAITGSDVTGHDLTQGGMDYIPISELKVGFDYLALGHIHCPQTLGTAAPSIHGTGSGSTDDERLVVTSMDSLEKRSQFSVPSEVTAVGVESVPHACARYCGSPIPVNFDERYVHSVTIVEIEKHGDQPLLRIIPIFNPWPLKTFPKEAQPFEEVLKELALFPDDEKAYLRLHVKLEDVPPQHALERAAEAVRNKKCRFCCFKWVYPEERSVKVRSFEDVEQIKSRSPLDIAELYYENKFGQPLSDDLKDMLKTVISEVQEHND